MSQMKEYEDQKKVLQSEKEQSNAHYNSLNLPGDRTFGVDADAVRKRIAEMAKQKAKPNHDEK